MIFIWTKRAVIKLEEKRMEPQRTQREEGTKKLLFH